jgi:hypothetical protein
LATYPNCGKFLKKKNILCKFKLLLKRTLLRNNKKYALNMGYETVNESLQWLRLELRYRKNAPYDDVNTSEIDNPQPSL